MIIQSTTLDTEEKVIDIYGGTSWSKIEGRFLLGQSSSHAINSTGGSETVTLTVQQIPSHSHSIATYDYSGGGAGVSRHNGNVNGGAPSYPSTLATGGSQPHNNMPPFKTVYIWERTA